MPIGITDEHAELAASLRKWAESTGAVEAVRKAEGDPASLAGWATLAAEVGLTSIALPEPVGGGGTLVDQAVATEAAARALVPGPQLSSTVAGLALAEGHGLLSGIADGSVRFGLELGGIVLDGPTATHVLTEDGRLVEGPTLLDVPSAELGRGTSTLAEVAPSDAVVDPARVRRLVLTLAAAECSGIASWCVETAVDHAKVREQFGTRIGAFQAIKHLCAEMLETSESVTAAAWDAAQAEREGEEQWELATRVARLICLDGAVEVAQQCIQVLGGIGFTFEHDAHLHLRRAIALRALLGGDATDLAEQGARGVRRALQLDYEGRDAEVRAEVREAVQRVTAADDRRQGLVETGLLVPQWPAPHGRGADAVEQLVIDEELRAAGIERPDLKIGAWAAPTILTHGDDAQRARFVGPTLRGEIVWCQLFSEPGAGSDLAGLRTRATRDEGGWRLSGQKVWTSLAHQADWGICLARTSTEEKPHAGITYFLLDMRSEGIDIRPLREMTGEEMFNEVFLDDVFVPDECVVGEVGGGWRLAVTTLANERVAMAGTRLDESVERALGLHAEASLVERDRIGRAVAWATVVKLLAARATLRSLAGAGPGPESSIAKLVGVRSRQDAAELVVELLGPRLFADDELAREALHQQLLTRCLSIAGGTTQILRNVVGERILGLPRG